MSKQEDIFINIYCNIIQPNPIRIMYYHLVVSIEGISVKHVLRKKFQIIILLHTKKLHF